MRLASSSSSGSLLERSDEQATRTLVPFPEILNQNNKRRDKKDSEDPSGRSSLLVNGFERKSGGHRISSIRTQFSGIRSRTCDSGKRNQGSTVFLLTSQKTEIAMSA